jgi:TolB protein
VQGRRPSLSLDGRLLAFISNRDGGNRIWVSAPDGSEARSLGVYALDYSTPAWSPTGKHIAFAAMTDENGQDIFTVEVSGGEGKYHEVYSSPGYDASPCWVRSQKP